MAGKEVRVRVVRLTRIKVTNSRQRRSRFVENHSHMLRAVRRPSTRLCLCSIPLTAVFRPYGAEKPLHSQQIALARSLVSNIWSSSDNVGRGWWPLCIRGDVRQRTQVEVREDGATASGAFHVQPEPLVDALHVKIVSTGQTSDLQQTVGLVNTHTSPLLDQNRPFFYLVSNAKLLQAYWTLTAISWNCLEPELWKFLNKCLHCFSLYAKRNQKLIHLKTKVDLCSFVT